MDDDPVPRKNKGRFYNKTARNFKTSILNITAFADWTQNKNVSAYNSNSFQSSKHDIGKREFFISKEYTAKSIFAVGSIMPNFNLLFTLANAESEATKF